MIEQYLYTIFFFLNFWNEKIKQLTVLSRLRNLDDQTKKIVTTMPVTYDITKDSFYKEGLEVGVEKTKQETITTMLVKGMEVKLISEIMKVTQKYVKQIKKEIQNDK